MKKLKCKKCGLRFKDRQNKNEPMYDSKLCFNCAFIIQCLRATIDSLGKKNHFMSKPLNRFIVLNMDNIKITKLCTTT